MSEPKQLVLTYSIRENADDVVKKLVETIYENKLRGREVKVKTWFDDVSALAYIAIYFPEGVEDDK